MQTVREYLPKRWAGRWGALNGHHVHLTQHQWICFCWGVVKNMVYEINPHTVNELKDYISDAFTEIDGDQNLCCIVSVFWTGMKIECGHVEHLRD